MESAPTRRPGRGTLAPSPAFLPTTAREMRSRGWSRADIILVTGDAYVDHPSYGTAVIGRVLESAGYRVAVIAQPDWRSTAAFETLGPPRLFFGITAGNLDSMVANYTSGRHPRKTDDYSPGGKPGLRPDRASIVYANRIREAFPGVPIVLGGIEASLRRLAHYDWWDNRVRRSILLDSRATILVYGMGERQVVEIAARLDHGRELHGIRGTVLVMRDAGLLDSMVSLPSFEDTEHNGDRFNEAMGLIYRNRDPFTAKPLVQRHGTRYVVQYPPPLPLSTEELDRVYDLPYSRLPHPDYERAGGVRGFETVRHSLISHRGCCGECHFCSLTLHQGRIIQSRSGESILAEARLLAGRDDFRGTITDIGGPTANLYRATCARWAEKGACPERNCLTPTPCPALKTGNSESIGLYRELRRIPGINHVFVESGFRHDLLVGEERRGYLMEICRHHVSGRMKVAPEHTADSVLRLMNKPPVSVYEGFTATFADIHKRIGKEQYLIPYFITAHPGARLEDTLQLALYLKKRGIRPEQIQDYIPLPMTISTAMYHTGKHPLSGEPVYVARSFRERRMHRALVQYWLPANRDLVREALEILGREDLFPAFFVGHPTSRREKRRHRPGN